MKIKDELKVLKKLYKEIEDGEYCMWEEYIKDFIDYEIEEPIPSPINIVKSFLNERIEEKLDVIRENNQ